MDFTYKIALKNSADLQNYLRSVAENKDINDEDKLKEAMKFPFEFEYIPVENTEKE